MKMKREHKGFIRRQIIIYIAALCLFTFATIGIGYIISSYYQEKDLQVKNTTLLNQSIDQIEDTIAHLDRMSFTSLLQSSAMTDFMDKSFSQKSTGDRFTTMKELQSTISSMHGVYPFLYGVFCSSFANEIVLADDGMYTLQEYNEVLLDQPLPSISNNFTSFEKRRITIESPINTPRITSTIAMARKYPVDTSASKGMVALYINEAALFDMLKEPLRTNGARLSIFDSNGLLYMYNGQGSVQDPDASNEVLRLYNQMKNQGLSYMQSEQSGRVHMAASDYTGWVYIMEVPIARGVGILHTMRLLFLLIIIVYTAFVIASVLYMQRSAYSGIDRLARIVRAHMGDKSGHSYTLDALTGAIEKITDESSNLQRDLQKMRPFAITQKLSELLHTNTASAAEQALDELEELHVYLHRDAFCVYIILLDQMPAETAESAIAQIVQNTLEDGMLAVSLEQTPGSHVVITSFNSMNRTQNQERLQGHLESVQEAIGYILSQECFIGVGSIPSKTIGLHSSYQSASEALKYRLFYKESSIIVYEKLLEGENTSVLEAEKLSSAIIVGLRQGESQQMLQSIQQFFKRLLRERTSISLFNMMLTELLLKGLRTGADMGVDLSILYESEYKDLLNILETSQSIDEITSAVQEFFLFISRNIARKRNHRGTVQMGARAVQYVNERYAQPDLSLTTIAELLGINESYASRVFKEYASVNFLDYLISIRMEHAKELLLLSGKSVAEIANKVGYTNINSFSRAFRKTQGVSPGVWRDRHTPHANQLQA